ncbi:MAG: DNA-binding protein [Methylobacillus sp.]|nr:DNA-binding protein [Methylobacillus sp.]
MTLLATVKVAEAAKFLGISPKNLRLKAKQGLIPGAKPGRDWVFIEDDLISYMRGLYSNGSTSKREVVILCPSSQKNSSNAGKSGGSDLLIQKVVSRLDSLRAHATKKPPRRSLTK